jgi:uracil-DNA glycosylase
LFAAFAQPLDRVRYVLVGEGPYPRAESATGVCFMDGAVGDLWSEAGLSKPVNRATSLRNFMKMLLVADGQLQLENDRWRGAWRRWRPRGRTVRSGPWRSCRTT